MRESRASRRWAVLWAQVASEMHPDSSSQSWGLGAERGWPGVGGRPVAERTAHHPLLPPRTCPSLARAGTWAPGCSPMASPSRSPRCPLDGAVGGSRLIWQKPTCWPPYGICPLQGWLTPTPWCPMRAGVCLCWSLDTFQTLLGWLALRAPGYCGSGGAMQSLLEVLSVGSWQKHLWKAAVLTKMWHVPT